LKQGVETDPLKAYLDSLAGADLVVSSILTHTELHRIVERDPKIFPTWARTGRCPGFLSFCARSDVLLRRGHSRQRSPIPGRALQVAVAMQIGADAMISDDARQQAAATAVGVRIVQPQ